MNNGQLNRLQGYHVLDGLFSRYAEETGRIAAFPAKLAAFNARLAEIDRLATQQALLLDPALVARDAALEAAISTTLAIGSLAMSYAETVQNHTLASFVRVHPSYFTKIRYDARVRLMRRIHHACAGALAQLREYGVAPGMLAEWEAQIDAAEGTLNIPRNTTCDKVVATLELKRAFRAMSTLLSGQIDPLMISFQRTNPDFYLHYQTARAIVHRRGPRRTPKAETPATAPVEDAIPAPGEPQPLAA